MKAETDLPAACRRQIERCGSRSAEARAAFRQFHDAWFDEVAGWARARMAAGVYDADDLAVATFWKAWQWIGGTAGLPAPEVLLRTCLERAHSDWLRQAYGRRAVDSHLLPAAGADARRPLSLDYALPGARALIEALADAEDVETGVLEREALREHLEALPGQVRACVRCRYVEGRSVADTAALLGLTTDQVKKRAAQGLALLARHLHGEEGRL